MYVSLEGEHLAQRASARLLVLTVDTHRKLVSPAGIKRHEAHEIAPARLGAATRNVDVALPSLYLAANRRNRTSMQALGIANLVGKLNHVICGYLRTTVTTTSPAATVASASTAISTDSNSALLETATTTQSL